uniref:flagellar protein MotX n=1 Tax=Thaumasiovibrio occultus TaxID=1891184 RepID=UPI000B357B64|nr:tetratricopeptide repeat protein [Thaumasiovibrio occultus]
MKLKLKLLATLLISQLSYANTDLAMGPVEVYSEAQLIRWFDSNEHLRQIKADECQIVEDIAARAQVVEYPAFQFLYGDMLAWGVCVERDVELGIFYINQAARQGLPAALEQLGRYYANGTLVQQDQERAIPYLREAAALGHLKARLLLAELLLKDYGSPLDYEDAYRWLYNTSTANEAAHRRIAQLRRGLEQRMPANAIQRAKMRDTFW